MRTFQPVLELNPKPPALVTDRARNRLKIIGKFLCFASLALSVSGCLGEPEIEVQLLPNDLGAYAIIMITNTGRETKEVQGVRANGSLQAEAWLGSYPNAGPFPARLAEGEQILVSNPVPWGNRTTRIDVMVDGTEYEYTF